MSKAVFITGTGTDMGKTYLSGLIVKKLAQAGKNPAYYKAAMSGNDRRADGSLIPGDALFVKEMSGISQSLDDMCPYVYENAWSPHLASRVEGNPVDLDVVRRGFLKAANDYEYITMEGSGGILCPLCFDERKIQLEDVIREFELSSILVADAGLGTINSVVLTAEYMKAHSLPIKGIIFNHYHPGNIMEEDNIAIVAFYIIPEINFLYVSQAIYYIVFFVCGILFCRYEKEVIDYLHLRSWGMMILLGVLSVSSPYIILPIYFAIIYALIGIFFSISLVLNLQKKNIKIFPKLRKYTYTIFLLSWFSQSFCRTVLMSHFNFYLL